MQLGSQDEIVNGMHEFMRSCIPPNGIYFFEKPVIYRKSPHEPSVYVCWIDLESDYRNNRPLLACICQRLRRLIYEDSRIREN